MGTVAQEKFSETTIGYRNQEEGEMWKLLLGKSVLGIAFKAGGYSNQLISIITLVDSEKFKVSLIEDVAGVSLCGALKSE